MSGPAQLVTIVRAPGLAPDPRFPLGNAELRGLLAVMLPAMGMDHAAFALRLVGDAEIARLNSEFLGCMGPTNVLSFPSGGEQGKGAMEGDDAQGENLGEIALSVDTLARETELYGQIPAEHTARLLAHAVLHLAGYDHGPEMEMLTDAAVQGFVPEGAR